MIALFDWLAVQPASVPLAVVCLFVSFIFSGVEAGLLAVNPPRVASMAKLVPSTVTVPVNGDSPLAVVSRCSVTSRGARPSRAIWPAASPFGFKAPFNE